MARVVKRARGVFVAGLVSLFCAACHPKFSQGPATPHPAAEAKTTVLRQHPELGVKDSPFNKAFVDIYNYRVASQPDSLTGPGWPLDVAREAEKTLGIAAEPSATPAGSWMKSATTSLNKGAYDRRKGPGSAVIYGTSPSSIYYRPPTYVPPPPVVHGDP